MVWRVLTSVAIAALLCLAPGCSSPPKLQPQGTARITVAVDQSRLTATVHLLDEVVVQLPPIQVAGTQWLLVYNDERFLQALAPLAGTPDGGATMRFLAIRAGRRIIRFFAVPPGKEAVPTQACELVIEIPAPGDA